MILHKCKPTHRETVPVEERTSEGEIVWRGDVEAFDLSGHEEAKTCYAWQHINSLGGAKIFAVLRNQFIDSPKRAVQAAIFVDAQPPLFKFTKEMEQLKQLLEECKNLLARITMKTGTFSTTVHEARGVIDTANQSRVV